MVPKYRRADIATAKHPGATKSAMRIKPKIVVSAIKFGGNTKGIAKCTNPKIKMNAASAVAMLTVHARIFISPKLFRVTLTRH